jgi:hypothetical protein
MSKKDTAIERAITSLGGMHLASMATGIPYQTLQSLRRRGGGGSYKSLRALSEASGVPMDELAGYQPPPQRKTA